MKVLLLNGSSHEKGTTMRALEEMITVFHSLGVETEVFQLGSRPYADCLQCGYCSRAGHCVIKDDGVNEFVEKAAGADGFIFATPTYYAHPSGRILTFLDRVFYSNRPDGNRYQAFKFKPGAAVAVARRAGTSATLDALNKYFGISGMPVAGSTYWNDAFGLEAGEVPQDEEGMQTLRNLARNLVWLMKCIEKGKDGGVPYPEMETASVTNFIKRADARR